MTANYCLFGKCLNNARTLFGIETVEISRAVEAAASPIQNVRINYRYSNYHERVDYMTLVNPVSTIHSPVFGLATEAFLYRRLETLPETAGRFRLNAALPIPFDGQGQMEVDLL